MILRETAKRDIVASACAFVFMVVLVTFGVSTERSRLGQELRAHVAHEAMILSSRLKSEINANVFLANGLAAYIIAQNGDIAASAEQALAALYHHGRHIRNIGVAPGNRLDHIFPLAGSEAAVGLYYPDVPQQWPAVRAAIEAGSTVLAGPLTLVQGGRGLISRTPVFMPDGQYWGIISIVLDAEALFAAAGISGEMTGVHIAMRHAPSGEEGSATFLGDTALFDDTSIRLPLHFPGTTWEMAVAPVEGWAISSPWLRTAQLGGYILSLLLAIALYQTLSGRALLAEREKRLRVLVKQSQHAQTALERSNSDLEQFAYAASHDLRQPLRMISSYTQLLDRSLRGSLGGTEREFMGYILDGAKRMDQMLLALLEYSRVVHQGEPIAPIESRRLAEQDLSFLKPLIEESGGQVRLHGDWPVIKAGQNEGVRLFQNLIGNALKYRAPDRTPEVDVSVIAKGPFWEFTITDNGIGIDPSQLDRLFQIFQRLHTRDQYEGNGIGLAICRKIIERHGGTIGVESEGEGKGSTFHFTLPVMPDNQRSGKDQAPCAP